MNANDELTRLLGAMQKEHGQVAEKEADPYEKVQQKIDELDTLLKSIATELVEIGFRVGSVSAELNTRDPNDKLRDECMDIQYRIFSLLEQNNDNTTI